MMTLDPRVCPGVSTRLFINRFLVNKSFNSPNLLLSIEVSRLMTCLWYRCIPSTTTPILFNPHVIPLDSIPALKSVSSPRPRDIHPQFNDSSNDFLPLTRGFQISQQSFMFLDRKLPDTRVSNPGVMTPRRSNWQLGDSLPSLPRSNPKSGKQ